ncbi:MAG: hypothetical protein QNK11_02975 [Legionella sp.]|nr:hypothetical protein [Legionella sp.]
MPYTRRQQPQNSTAAPSERLNAYVNRPGLSLFNSSSANPYVTPPQSPRNNAETGGFQTAAELLQDLEEVQAALDTARRINFG